MNKLFCVFAIVFGMVAGVNAQFWDSIPVPNGKPLVIAEDMPGKLVIKADEWTKEMDFPVHIRSSQDTLIILENPDLVSSGLVVFYLEPTIENGRRVYHFSISDADGRRARYWFPGGYKPNTHPYPYP